MRLGAILLRQTTMSHKILIKQMKRQSYMLVVTDIVSVNDAADGIERVLGRTADAHGKPREVHSPSGSAIPFCILRSDDENQ